MLFCLRRRELIRASLSKTHLANLMIWQVAKTYGKLDFFSISNSLSIRLDKLKKKAHNHNNQINYLFLHRSRAWLFAWPRCDCLPIRGIEFVLCVAAAPWGAPPAARLFQPWRAPPAPVRCHCEGLLLPLCGGLLVAAVKVCCLSSPPRLQRCSSPIGFHSFYCTIFFVFQI